MRAIRSRLTYGNVVATVALFLALSGGVVWAANKITSKQIGKGAVKNKNLAKNAVRAKNLAKGSVTAAKLGKNAVGNAAIADGAVSFAKLAAGSEVVASATGGPVPADQDNPVNIPLNPPISLTPVAGQPLIVSVEVRGTVVASNAEDTCEAVVVPVLNGNPLLIGEVFGLVSPSATPKPPFGNGTQVAGGRFPVGLTEPGVPQSIQLSVVGRSGKLRSGIEGRPGQRRRDGGKVMRAIDRVRARLTYVNVVGTIALFLTLSGGVVWAANKITSKQIGKGAVKNKNLAKNAVKAKNLAKGSVTAAKLAKSAVKNANARRRLGQLRQTGRAGRTSSRRLQRARLDPAWRSIHAGSPQPAVERDPGCRSAAQRQHRSPRHDRPGRRPLLRGLPVPGCERQLSCDRRASCAGLPHTRARIALPERSQYGGSDISAREHAAGGGTERDTPGGPRGEMRSLVSDRTDHSGRHPGQVRRRASGLDPAGGRARPSAESRRAHHLSLSSIARS